MVKKISNFLLMNCLLFIDNREEIVKYSKKLQSYLKITKEFYYFSNYFKRLINRKNPMKYDNLIEKLKNKKNISEDFIKEKLEEYLISFSMKNYLSLDINDQFSQNFMLKYPENIILKINDNETNIDILKKSKIKRLNLSGEKLKNNNFNNFFEEIIGNTDLIELKIKGFNLSNNIIKFINQNKNLEKVEIIFNYENPSNCNNTILNFMYDLKKIKELKISSFPNGNILFNNSNFPFYNLIKLSIIPNITKYNLNNLRQIKFPNQLINLKSCSLLIDIIHYNFNIDLIKNNKNLEEIECIIPEDYYLNYEILKEISDNKNIKKLIINKKYGNNNSLDYLGDDNSKYYYNTVDKKKISEIICDNIICLETNTEQICNSNFPNLKKLIVKNIEKLNDFEYLKFEKFVVEKIRYFIPNFSKVNSLKKITIKDTEGILDLDILKFLNHYKTNINKLDKLKIYIKSENFSYIFNQIEKPIPNLDIKIV